MQLDLCLLHNVRSETTSSVRGDLKGGRTTERASQLDNQGGDFRSNLKRAQARKKMESPRSRNRDDSAVQTKNRPQGMSRSRNPKAIRSAEDTPGCHRHERQKAVPENGDHTSENTEVFFETPVDAGTVDSASPIPVNSIAAGPAAAITPEIAILSESAKALSAEPAPTVTGTGETTAAAAAVLKDKAPDGMGPFTVPAAVVPEDTDADVKPSLTNDVPEVGGDAIDDSSDPSENAAMEKVLSESQKKASQHDRSAKAVENAADGRLDKIAADGAFEADRQTAATAKKSGPTAPTPEGVRVAEDQNRKAAVDPANGRAEPDRVERLVVDSERGPRTELPPAGQNGSRGAGDTSGAMVSKNPLDADQSAKVNEHFPASQRPVAGEGNIQALPQTPGAQTSAPKAEVLNQIVDRAVFKLNNGQSEVRIDLKPDFLGHVRLQIVTENHQVSLRILAESAAVKDLIDGHLGQLKNDLQAQGLKVDEIDVTVAKDFNSHDRRSGYAAHGDRGRRGLPFKGRDFEEKGISGGSRMAARLAQRAGGINCFA